MLNASSTYSAGSALLASRAVPKEIDNASAGRNQSQNSHNGAESSQCDESFSDDSIEMSESSIKDVNPAINHEPRVHYASSSVGNDIATMLDEDPLGLPLSSASTCNSKITYYSKIDHSASQISANYIRTDILNIASAMKVQRQHIGQAMKTTIGLCFSLRRTCFDSIDKFKFKRLENLKIMNNQFSYFTDKNGDYFENISGSASHTSHNTSNISPSMLLSREQFKRNLKANETKVIGPGGVLHTRYHSSSAGSSNPSLWDGTEYKLNILKSLDRKLQLKIAFESILQFCKSRKAIVSFLDANSRWRSRELLGMCFMALRLYMLSARYIKMISDMKVSTYVKRKYGRPALVRLGSWRLHRLDTVALHKKMLKLSILNSKLRAVKRLVLLRLTAKQNEALRGWIYKRSQIGCILAHFTKWKNTFIYRNLNKLSLYNRLSQNARLFVDINFDTLDIANKDELHMIQMDFNRDEDRALVMALGGIYQPSRLHRSLLSGHVSHSGFETSTSIFKLNYYRIQLIRSIIATSLERASRGDLYTRQMKAYLGRLPPSVGVGREIREKMTSIINKVIYIRKALSLPGPQNNINNQNNNKLFQVSGNYEKIINSTNRSRGSGSKLESSRSSQHYFDDSSSDNSFISDSRSVGYAEQRQVIRPHSRDSLNRSRGVGGRKNNRNIISVYFIDKALNLIRRNNQELDITREHKVAMMLIDKGISLLRFWSYYANTRIASKTCRELRLRNTLKRRVLIWKKAYRVSKKNEEMKFELFDKMILSRAFKTFKNNTVVNTNLKVASLKRYVIERNILLSRFSHWRLVLDDSISDRLNNRIAEKLIKKKRFSLIKAIFVAWKSDTMLSIAYRKVSTVTNTKLLKQYVFPNWIRKMRVRRLLCRVFHTFNLCWSMRIEDEASRLSPFQVKYKLFNEWRREVIESLSIRRQEENELKALEFRGLALTSKHFCIWKIFLKAVKLDRAQDVRRTNMIFRLCFYHLACFSAQSRKHWSQFRDRVRFRMKKRVFYGWKVFILKYELTLPSKYYHKTLLVGNLRNWKLYIKMKKASRLPMPSLDLEQYVRPMFLDWIDLFNRRIRYKKGLKLLENSIGKRYLMRCMLYRFPGRKEFLISEEHRRTRLLNPKNTVRILSTIAKVEADLKAPKKWSKFDMLVANADKKLKFETRGDTAEIARYDVEGIKSFIEFLPEPLRIRAANMNCFTVEGCSVEENTQRVYFIMSSMLHAWYRYARYMQKLRYRERLLKVAHFRHVLYRTMKHWVLSVSRTNHRHFTWLPNKVFKPHNAYVEETKKQEQMFYKLYSSGDKEIDIANKDRIAVEEYNNAYGAYDRASSYISKNKFN